MTEKNLIADFEKRVQQESKNLRPSETRTLVPGDSRFFTAFAVDAENKKRILTVEDLEQLQTGVEVPFVLAVFTYRDRGEIHHTRACAWLQPPPNPPGIWHFCEGFNNSD
jgi:hypothetical protein